LADAQKIKDNMKQLKAISYRDFSKGSWNGISTALAPENSLKAGINFDTDFCLGEAVSRDGTTIIGSQLVDNYPVLGIHNFRDSVGTSNTKIFAAVSDGTNNDIWDVVAGTKSLENDTKDLKTRFLTYLDSCLRLNGTDGAKAYNGSSWVTTGGAFDLGNLPTGSKYAIEFKDRVYVAGSTTNPDRVDISGIANSVTRAVSWTSGNKFIVLEQEDGGGGITGLAKVPGYVLVFKKRTMKRWDGSSAYPEDMVNQGAPSQEAIVTAKGMCGWVNENGAWMSTGGEPKKISSYTVDEIIKSCSATNLLNVASGTDEDHMYWSFASVTISGETYTNVVLKYNILTNTWDIRKYAMLPRCFCKYVDSTGAVFTIFGDDDGRVQKLNTGTTDNGSAIEYSLETQDLEFGTRLYAKEIKKIGVFVKNIPNANFMYRTKDGAEDWDIIGKISGDVNEFKTKIVGNYFNFKITGLTTTGKARVLGLEFPEGSITIYD